MARSSATKSKTKTRPLVGSVYLHKGTRGLLHAKIVGSNRTICGLFTELVPAPVTVHDRITCGICVGIVQLVRDGYVDLIQPDQSESG